MITTEEKKNVLGEIETRIENFLSDWLFYRSIEENESDLFTFTKSQLHHLLLNYDGLLGSIINNK